MTKEQQQLINKARDSLKAARLLANEGLYEFSISRAYYTIIGNRTLTHQRRFSSAIALLRRNN